MSQQKADEAVRSLSAEGAVCILEGATPTAANSAFATATTSDVWQDFDQRVSKSE